MRINFAPKLFIGFLVVISMNVFFLVIVSKIEGFSGIAAILKKQNEIADVLATIKSQHDAQGMSAFSYERVGRPESIDNFRNGNKRVCSLLDTLSISLDTIIHLDSVISVQNRTARAFSNFQGVSSHAKNISIFNALYNKMFDSLITFRSYPSPDVNRTGTLRIVFDDADVKFKAYVDSVQALIDNQTRFYITEVDNRVVNVKQVSFAIIAGMTVFAILFGLFFSRATTNALRKLKESASTIGKGDFDFDPSGYPTDEIGDVAAAFFDMANDLKNAQDELVRSKRLAAIGEVIASVNHEINNPLMIISGNAQFLEMMMDGYPEEMKERVRAILEETERISMVTRKLREIKNPVVEDYTSSGEQMINLDKSTQ